MVEVRKTREFDARLKLKDPKARSSKSSRAYNG
jgi:hypothetical protein